MLICSGMRRKSGNHEQIGGSERGGSDRLSGAGPAQRRAVHPYRDDGGRDALVAERRAKERELADADRAAERRDRLKKELAVIDHELQTRSSPLLDAIAITTRCHARWDDMRGDDVVRRCGRCHRDVHDLSKMTEKEIEALFARIGPTACVRLRRRPDGRVVTADCPVEPPTLLARGAKMVAAGMLFGATAGISATVMQPEVVAPVLPDEEPPDARAAAERLPVADVPAPDVKVNALRSVPEPGENEPAEHEDVEPDVGRYIRWIAPQAWEIDRALFEGGHLPDRVTSYRVVPSDSGFRVYGVRRASVFGRLGLQNGDVIASVNGIPLDHSAGLMEAYDQLRDADAFFVRILRRGEEHLHVYRIKP